MKLMGKKKLIYLVIKTLFAFITLILLFEMVVKKNILSRNFFYFILFYKLTAHSVHVTNINKKKKNNSMWKNKSYYISRLIMQSKETYQNSKSKGKLFSVANNIILKSLVIRQIPKLCVAVFSHFDHKRHCHEYPLKTFFSAATNDLIDHFLGVVF